jgi:hypothetical protein
MAPASMPWTAVQGPCQRFARNCATRSLASPHTQLSTTPLTCLVAWISEVMHGVVNHPHIDGMQGVRGSNPLSSTPGQRPDSPSAVPGSPRQIGSNHHCAGRSVAHRGTIPAALARAVSWSDLPTAITPRSGGIRTPTVTVRAHPARSRIPQLSRGSSGASKYFWQVVRHPPGSYVSIV